MKTPARSGFARWKLRGIVCVAALVAYSDCFGLGFAGDIHTLLADPRVQAVSAGNIALIFDKDYWWPSSADRLYRPLTTASFLVNFSVLGSGGPSTGGGAAGYHAANVALHLLNTCFVLELALLALGGTAPAVFAAGLWAVHPIGTEAVANIAGRADLLAAAFTLAGLLLYIRMGRMSARHVAAGAAGLFALSTAAVLSKESGAVLIGLMLVWDAAFGPAWKENSRWRAFAYAAVAISLAAAWCLRVWVFSGAPWPEMPWVDNPLRTAGFWHSRWTAVKVIGLELALLVYPVPLAMDRAYNQIPESGLSDPGAWLSFAVIAAITAVVLARRRRDPVLFWAAGFFAAALLPASNLVATIGSIMAERFLYLPSIGFAIAVVALAFRAGRPRVAHVALACAAALCAGRTFARNLAWTDNLALARSDVRTAPRDFRVHHMLAEALMAQDSRRNLDEAIRQAESAWEILSPLPPGRVFQQTPAVLGLYYRLKGDSIGSREPSARGWYEKSLAVLLRAREASQAYERAYDEAQPAHGKPLATRVVYLPVYLSLGATCARLGRYADAVEAYRYARDVDPRNPEAYEGMAAAYLQSGQPRLAAIALEERAAVEGLTPRTLAQIGRVYGAASCAVEYQGSAGRLNLACPQLHEDMCAAWSEVATALDRARLPDGAAQFRRVATDNGCVAAGK